jgi:Skp family chaperone for outer membrane proteins
MESAQRQLESRQQGFQESYSLFQQMAPSMSEAELARNQEDLMGLQQQLVGLQQELEQDLMEKEGELLMKLKTEIDSVLVITKDEIGLDFVFTYQPGSPLLYANESFDITKGVVQKLNSWHPENVIEIKE